MSSDEQTPAPSTQPQQQQQKVRKPPLSDWPTIKILTPPQGRFSPKIDEWCFTYCSQTVSGRIHGKEPNCGTICLRKVFPHEVRNILSYKRHHSVAADGKAKYPLPAEGQSANLPRILGGSVPDDEDHPTPTASAPTKFWDEGWYLWTGKGRWAVLQKTEKMMFDLENQQQLDKVRESRKEIWQDYQEKLNQPGGERGHIPRGAQWWGPIVPPSTSTTIEAPSSLLVPLPPDFSPVLASVHKLLAPTVQVMGILRESISSGEQKEFAQRVWEKAKTDEPFVLAQRTFSRAYEQWKKRDVAEEDDGKKPGST